MAQPIISECLICSGAVVSTENRARKFCSSACYHAAQRRGMVKVGREHLPKNVHVCDHCGARVLGQRHKNRDGTDCKRIFCSQRCYQSFRDSLKESRRHACGCCGVSFIASPGRYRIRFCSDECRRAARRPPPCTCMVCGASFTAIVFRGRHVVRLRRQICSAECKSEFYRRDEARKRKISRAFTGDSHPNWQGGTHRSGFRGHSWQQIAEDVRKRAEYCCEHCGMSQDEHLKRWKMRLNVNHKEPFHQQRRKTLANVMSNLEALCKSCHTKADWQWRKTHPVQYSMDLR